MGTAAMVNSHALQLLLATALLVSASIRGSSNCTGVPGESCDSCFRHATNCSSSGPHAPVFYCPHNDSAWGSNTPNGKDCLNEPCFHILNASANASCASLCSPLWDAANICLQDDCDFALASGDPKVCPFNRFVTWDGGELPNTTAVKKCRAFE